jgi:hypothetical protein
MLAALVGDGDVALGGVVVGPALAVPVSVVSLVRQTVSLRSVLWVCFIASRAGVSARRVASG